MIIFGAPSRYIQGPGIIETIGHELAKLGSEAIIVLDPLIQDRYGDVIAASCRAANVKAAQVTFSGECTPEEVERIAEEAVTTYPIVVSTGGGKCIDAGKALANKTGALVVTIPTIASTDAPTSHNYVMYDSQNKMLGVEKLMRNPALVVVDTEIICRAPKRLFVAGIGDAIGKVYEVEACANNAGKNIFGGQSSLAAVALARACQAVVLEHANEALAAIDAGSPNESLERVVEATVLMSGLAFESGGLSISHSMTRGLTALKPWSETLHGYQVAYANLVQLRLEGRPTAQIDELADFYSRVGLPRSLAELCLLPDDAALGVIVNLSMAAPHIRHFKRDISHDDLRGAMLWVEKKFATT